MRPPLGAPFRPRASELAGEPARMEALLEECRGVKTKWLYGVVESITVGVQHVVHGTGDSWTPDPRGREFAHIVAFWAGERA